MSRDTASVSTNVLRARGIPSCFDSGAERKRRARAYVPHYARQRRDNRLKR
jgi:hypothetical protein